MNPANITSPTRAAASSSAAQPAPGVAWGERLRILMRFCLSDPDNPFYRLNSRPWGKWPAGGARSRRRKAAAWIVLSAALAIAALLALQSVPRSRLDAIADYTSSITLVLVALAYGLPVLWMRRAYERALRSGRLEAVVLTRLTDKELLRGLAVPLMRKSLAVAAAAALILIVLPMTGAPVRLAPWVMRISLFVGIVVTQIAMTWIILGFVVRGLRLTTLLCIAGGLYALDPAILMCRAGLLDHDYRWDPLIFAFALIEIFYCVIKSLWAGLIVSELDATFRATITE